MYQDTATSTSSTTYELRYDGKRVKKRKLEEEEEEDSSSSSCSPLSQPYSLNRFPFWKELFWEDETEGDYYGTVSNHTTYSLTNGFNTLSGDATFEVSFDDTQRCRFTEEAYAKTKMKKGQKKKKNQNQWCRVDVETLLSIVSKEIPSINEHLLLEYVNRIYEYLQKNPGVTLQDLCSLLLILNEKTLSNSMDRSLTAKSKRKKRTRIDLIKALFR